VGGGEIWGFLPIPTQRPLHLSTPPLSLPPPPGTSHVRAYRDLSNAPPLPPAPRGRGRVMAVG
jgi:hypothetical protein